MANPPTWSNVKLLCHFDGTNGDTTTVDSSSSAHTIGNGSPRALTSAQAKFGATSTDSGSPGSWTVADHADWHFGSGEFTVEAWVRFTTAPSTNIQAIVQQWPGAPQLGWFFGMVSGEFAFYYSTTGSDNPKVGASWTPTLNQWYHLAADRDASNVLRVYIDGVVHASAVVSDTFYNSSGGTLHIAGQSTTWPGIIGFVDDLRIVKGEAVYGGAFTPPTAALPDGGSVNALVSQVALEVVRNDTAVIARLDQLALEISSAHPPPDVRLDQIVLEIMSDNFFPVTLSQTLKWDVERNQSGFFMLF